MAAAIATGVLASGSVAHAQATLAVLHSFAGGGTDGAQPYSALIQGPDGTLYGTTTGGGTMNAGTVFRLAPDGSGYTVLQSFTGGADGYAPYAGLIQGPDGTLYGTTYAGGTSSRGTVFQIAPDGSGFTVLHSFGGYPTDGATPTAALIQGPDGTLYGTTAGGGTSGFGTIFRLAPDGSGFTVLHSFGTDGAANPTAALIQGPDGALYGTTSLGGTNGQGTIFQMPPDGSGFTILYTFGGDGTDGGLPEAGLIQGPDGTLYGTTYFGGTSNLGTVFEIAPDGSGYTVLHSFIGTDGGNPRAGLMRGPDGTLYGATDFGGTSNAGVVFQLMLSPSARTSGRSAHK